jgi:hypothetical protein
VRLRDLNKPPDKDEESSNDFNNSQPTPEMNNNKKSERTPLSCIYCDPNKTFVYKKCFENHLKIHHCDEIIQCEYNKKCKKLFTTVKDLELHIISFHERRKNANSSNKKKACIMSPHKDEAIKHDFVQSQPTIIPNPFEKESQIDKEQSSTISVTVKCIYCKISLMNTQNLADHVEQTHAQLKIECNVAGCVTYFLTQLNRKAHYDEKHPDEEHSTSEDQLTDPIAAIPQNIGQLECPECAKLFKSELSFKYHVSFLCTIKQRYAFSEKNLK